MVLSEPLCIVTCSFHSEHCQEEDTFVPLRNSFSEGLLEEELPSLAWHPFTEEQEAYDVRQRRHSFK